MIKRLSLLTFAGFSLLWIANTSWLAPVPDINLKILSHRGVHQRFDETQLTNQTCTATRIETPRHDYLENTLRSIDAAFSFGADAVEIDIIQTADHHFVVFHDWTLECRTNGQGRTTDHTLAQLQALDIGYGYTSDQGKSFPFRAIMTEQMPSLRDVLTRFPDRDFQINVKGNRASDANALRTYLQQHSIILTPHTILFGGPRFAAQWRSFTSATKIGTKTAVKACAKSYLTFGWFGHVPDSCAGFGLTIPQNLAWVAAGWPRKTVSRLEKTGSRVMLVGPLGGDTQAIDTRERALKIPPDYHGWVLTNRIELVGPALKPKPTTQNANSNSY